MIVSTEEFIWKSIDVILPDLLDSKNESVFKTGVIISPSSGATENDWKSGTEVSK